MKKLILLSTLVSTLLLASEFGRDFENLTEKEKKDLAIAQKWINAKTTTIAGNNGDVVFLYGSSMPSIVTTPLRLTNIALEPGEVIKDVQIGDSVRWVVSLSLSGEEPNVISHVIVKPVDKDLQTTMNIMTNKRVYTLNLVSQPKDFMPSVSFNYTDSITNTLENYKQQLKAKSESKDFYKTKDENEIPSNVESLDFGYKIEGDTEFKPLRIYNDGIKTYMQMPKNMKFYEAPVLMILDKDDEKAQNKQLVNYRLKLDTFIVDRLFNKAVLILDIDDRQQRVIITKQSSKTNQEIVDNVLYDLSLQNK